ncbi:MAG: hypothetical protein ACI9CF_001820 [Candidatus Omnitrophota bacterium]|jgi:hypothetical protein
MLHRFSKRLYQVLDLSSVTTRAIILEWDASKSSCEILGIGEAATSGVSQSELTSISDVAESIWTAVNGASKQSGVVLKDLTVSLDDTMLESAKVQASSYLDGANDDFRHNHIEEARIKALQRLKPQDKHLVYQNASGFLIDGNDYIHDPIGICGKELTVVMYLLFSKSEWFQNLRFAVERAGYGLKGLYPSGLAALFGSVGPQKRHERGILCLSQYGAIHIVTHEYASIQDYQSYIVTPESQATLIKQISLKFDESKLDFKRYPIRVTGENAYWLIEAFEQELHLKVELVSPACESKHDIQKTYELSTALGLATLQSEDNPLEKIVSRIRLSKENIKSRIEAFVQDYF